MTCAIKCPPRKPFRPTARITLLEHDGSVNSAQEKDYTRANWDSIGGRWAEWKTRSGSERFASDVTQAGHSHRIKLRYDNITKTLTTDHRIALEVGTRWFGIDAVSDEDEAHLFMVLDVTETK